MRCEIDVCCPGVSRGQERSLACWCRVEKQRCGGTKVATGESEKPVGSNTAPPLRLSGSIYHLYPTLYRVMGWFYVATDSSTCISRG